MNPLALYREGKRIATLKPSGKPGECFYLGSAPACDVVVAEAAFGLAARQLRLVPGGSLWWAEELTGDGSLEADGGRRAAKLPIAGRVALKVRGFAFEAECGAPAGHASRRDLARDWLYERALFRLSQEIGGAEAVADAELERRVVGFLDETIRERPPQLAGLPDEALAELRAETVEDMLRLGPLEPLIADESVTEIMVVDHRRIYVERAGKLTLTTRHFRDPGHLIRVIERIVTPIGRRIDESSPLVDARLADGSRVNAVIPPITPDGACLTIRKFGKSLFTLDKLISIGSMTPGMARFIEASVALRKNIVVSGGTGSGKTSLLNAISLCIGGGERIVTIEDSLELKLQQDHVVRMEARPANAEGKGAVPIRALVANALRMRPDRIVVGECRGGEALDMLQAMNTGHDGSLTTVHANSPHALPDGRHGSATLGHPRPDRLRRQPHRPDRPPLRRLAQGHRRHRGPRPGRAGAAAPARPLRLPPARGGPEDAPGARRARGRGAAHLPGGVRPPRRPLRHHPFRRGAR